MIHCFPFPARIDFRHRIILFIISIILLFTRSRVASSPGHSQFFNVAFNIEKLGVAWGRG